MKSENKWQILEMSTAVPLFEVKMTCVFERIRNPARPGPLIILEETQSRKARRDKTCGPLGVTCVK